MPRAYAVRLPPWERMAFIKDRDRTCQYCGGTGDWWTCDGWPWEVDHIIPMRHGGAARDWSNLALACHWCNVLKIDTPLVDLPTRLAGERLRPDHAALMLSRQDLWPTAA